MRRTLHPGENARAPVAQGKLSFSEPKTQSERPQSAAPRVEGNHLAGHIDGAPPGDIARTASRRQSKADLARQKSKRDLFEDAFAVNPTSSPARARVHGDALVMAEVKTNVIVSDEFTFTTQLAYHLSTRYRRPVSSVAVALHHGACLFFAGSFDPAYVMSVVALPSQLQPTTNKRNAALIQKHMAETLGVGPARGLLRFVPGREEDFARGGNTMAGVIEELERGSCWGDGDCQEERIVSSTGVSPADAGLVVGGGSKGGKARRKLSVKSLAVLRPLMTSGMPTPESTPPASAEEAAQPALDLPASCLMAANKQQETQLLPPQQRAARKKKSFVAAIFGRPGNKPSDRSSLATIGDEG